MTSAGIAELVSEYDNIFLCRLVRHDWRQHHKHIRGLQEELLKGQPVERGSLVTTFNYTIVPPSITVSPCLAHRPDNYHTDKAARLQFDESVQRAISSGGRLALVSTCMEGIPSPRTPGFCTIVAPSPEED
jgi:hypothetical protein